MRILKVSHCLYQYYLKFPLKCLPIKNSGIKQDRLLNQVPFIQFISFYTYLQGKKAF